MSGNDIIHARSLFSIIFCDLQSGIELLVWNVAECFRYSKLKTQNPQLKTYNFLTPNNPSACGCGWDGAVCAEL